MFGFKVKQPLPAPVDADESEKQQRVIAFSAELQELCKRYNVELVVAQGITVQPK